MVISPQNDCTWTYHNGCLSIHLTTDEGQSYLFDTKYSVDQLFVRPEVNTQFCIEDATLLTDYQFGLDRVLKDEVSSFEYGLNAVACARFTRPAYPTSRYFIEHPRTRGNFERGDVVTIYTKSGDTGYCLVLEENDADGLVRLMLLTDSLVLDRVENRGYVKGNMIRVNDCCIYDLAGQYSNTERYA